MFKRGEAASGPSNKELATEQLEKIISSLKAGTAGCLLCNNRLVSRHKETTITITVTTAVRIEYGKENAVRGLETALSMLKNGTAKCMDYGGGKAYQTIAINAFRISWYIAITTASSLEEIDEAIQGIDEPKGEKR
jgi:hypothetical protein